MIWDTKLWEVSNHNFKQLKLKNFFSEVTTFRNKISEYRQISSNFFCGLNWWRQMYTKHPLNQSDRLQQTSKKNHCRWWFCFAWQNSRKIPWIPCFICQQHRQEITAKCSFKKCWNFLSKKENSNLLDSIPQLQCQNISKTQSCTAAHQHHHWISGLNRAFSPLTTPVTDTTGAPH